MKSLLTPSHPPYPSPLRGREKGRGSGNGRVKGDRMLSINKNILIVDDCKTTRKIIALYIKEAGYKTVLAANGVEAIEKLMNAAVDVIITDLNMPQMDGIELTRWVRENNMFKDIPLIILTTEQNDVSRVKGINTGASTFLTKPITKERLIEEINKFAVKVGGG